MGQGPTDGSSPFCEMHSDHDHGDGWGEGGAGTQTSDDPAHGPLADP